MVISVLLLAACASEEQTLSDDELVTSTTSGGPYPTTSTTGSSTSAGPPTETTPPADDVVVTRVVDGDTIEVSVGGVEERLRMIGINAPEDGECIADEATRWMRERIEGEAVTLVRDQTDRDQYGRLLRYVEIDGADVGVELVRSGLALARRYPPDTTRAAELDIVQRAAEDAGVGMWAPDACGQGATDAAVVISDIRFDADGDDNDNLNDEWVRITNESDGRADLTGWVLKDESASHRYRFSDGFGLDSGATVTVRTGCGTDTVTDVHWCTSGSAVWNNSGDTAFLLDAAGNIVDSRRG